MRCRECGREGEGNYCTACGAPLAGEPAAACARCGSELEAGARFCPGCGAGVEGRPRKPLSAYVPWILSGVALVAFAVAIGLFVQAQSQPRAPGMPPTGGLPTPERDEGAATGGAPAAGGAGEAGAMPSAAELAAMSPREAADRLFDRAMREQEGGNAERAAFFAQMAEQAYARVPAVQLDADARFHLGLLRLVRGDPAAARATADTILAESPGHLLGLIVAARAAEAEGRQAAADSLYRSLRRGVEAGALERRPEYGAHRAFIEAEAEKAPAPPGG